MHLIAHFLELKTTKFLKSLRQCNFVTRIQVSENMNYFLSTNDYNDDHTYHKTSLIRERQRERVSFKKIRSKGLSRTSETGGF